MRFASRFVLCLSLLAVPSLSFAEEAAPAASPTCAKRCPRGLEWRTPAQVFQDRLDAMMAGDLDRVMCDYSENAVLITAGGVAKGKAEIRASLEGLFAMLAGVMPTVSTLSIEGPMVYITWSVYAQMVSIPDGSDTFIIKHGKIHYQTAHAPMIFNAPPPADAPAAE